MVLCEKIATFAMEKIKIMDDNNVKQLKDLFGRLRRDNSRETAMETFVGAGILDKKGEFTKPYSGLKTIFVGAKD